MGSSWIDMPVMDRTVRIRYGGLLSQSVFDLADGEYRTGLMLGPVEDLLWVVLPELREMLAEELDVHLDLQADYGRGLSQLSWYEPFRMVAQLLKKALGGLPFTAHDASRCCSAVAQVIELNEVLNRYYLEPIQVELFGHLEDEDWRRLRAFASDVATRLAMLAPEIAADEPSYDPALPIVPLAPAAELGRGWLEVEVRPSRRIVRVRYGGIVSTTAFRIAPVSADVDVAEIGLDPFADEIWASLPELQRPIYELVRAELADAIRDGRPLGFLRPDAICIAVFEGFQRAASIGDQQLFGDMLDSLSNLMWIGEMVGGAHVDALRSKLIQGLIREPFRTQLATGRAVMIPRLEQYLAE